MNPFPQGCEEQTAFREGVSWGCGQCLSLALPSVFAMIPAGPGLSLSYDTRHAGGGPEPLNGFCAGFPPIHRVLC